VVGGLRRRHLLGFSAVSITRKRLRHSSQLSTSRTWLTRGGHVGCMELRGRRWQERGLYLVCRPARVGGTNTVSTNTRIHTHTHTHTINITIHAATITITNAVTAAHNNGRWSKRWQGTAIPAASGGRRAWPASLPPVRPGLGTTRNHDTTAGLYTALWWGWRRGVTAARPQVVGDL